MEALLVFVYNLKCKYDITVEIMFTICPDVIELLPNPPATFWNFRFPILSIMGIRGNKFFKLFFSEGFKEFIPCVTVTNAIFCLSTFFTGLAVCDVLLDAVRIVQKEVLLYGVFQSFFVIKFASLNVALKTSVRMSIDS